MDWKTLNTDLTVVVQPHYNLYKMELTKLHVMINHIDMDFLGAKW